MDKVGNERLKSLTLDTMIPLGALSVICYIIFWLAGVSGRGEANYVAIQEIKKDQSEQYKVLSDEIGKVGKNVEYIKGIMKLKEGK